MPWKTTFMEEGVIMVFVEAIMRKLCMVGGILREHSERKKERSLREKGDGGGRR